MRRSSDSRTDQTLAHAIGLGGKDVYRQARAIWNAALEGDVRACSSVVRLDANQQTIHAAYKDLRRRDRYTTGFKPTPYDVWNFRGDSSYGIPHPGSIPPSIIAHTLHYYSRPNDLIVDPFAGGGATIDVSLAMGRRCLAYDLDPKRPDVQRQDVRGGFAPETKDCDLIFADPPYFTMLAKEYDQSSVSNAPLSDWLRFLDQFALNSYSTLKPGGVLALLLANQTEKDLPAGFGYLDHAFFGYQALLRSGFLPERRVSCPMSGTHLPQNVARARREGRMLGVARDLLVVRKPLHPQESRASFPTTSS